MMIVDRKKIVFTNISSSAATIDVPISLDFTPIDNSELVEEKFVDDEIEKVINPIIDYKKIIFSPADNSSNWEIINEFKIILNFFTSDNLTYKSTYDTLNFTFDDLFCRTNRLMNSFLRLTLWDTPYTANNNIIGFLDIYTQMGKDQKNPYGFVLPLEDCPISFQMGDPVIKPNTVHEGYNMYWFQDLVDTSPNKEFEIYVTATYNNAFNGKSMGMYAVPTLDPTNVQIKDINVFDGPYYLKIVFKNDNGVYKYRFVANNNSQESANGGGINLSPSMGNPTLTFWQIAP